MWLTISYVCFTLGVVSLVVTIVMSIKWDIANMVRIVTGRGSRKHIERLIIQDALSTDKDLLSGTGASSHRTTQSLIERSMGYTKNLQTKAPLTKSENIRSQSISINPSKASKIDIKTNTNVIKSKTSPKVVNKAYISHERTEILVGDDEIYEESTQISSNLQSEPVVIDTSTNASEKVKNDDKTSVLSSALEDKTSILDSEDISITVTPTDKTSVLNIEELDEDVESEDVTSDDKTSILTVNKPDKTSLLFDQEDVEEFTNDGSSNISSSEDIEDGISSLDSWSNTTMLTNDASVGDPDEEVDSSDFDFGFEGTSEVQPTSTGNITTNPLKEIPIEAVNETVDEEDVEESNGKTQIITEDNDPNNYKKMLKEDFESIEFHEFRVVEVVTSY